MHVLRKPRVEQLQKKLINREIDRRDFMAAAATAGVAPVASSLVPSARAAEGDMIHYFTWSGYEPVELHQPFFDKYGRSPDWSIFASAEDGLQKIRAGFVADLAHPCVDGVPRWHDAGVVQPIDPSRVSYWDDMFPALHTMNGAVIDGDLYMVITDFGLSSMIYRTDIIEGEESWMYMYDEKYAGRICARNTTASIFVPLKILGYDPMNPTPEQVMEAAEMARKQRDLVRFYWDSQTDMEQAIASGECVVAYAWNEALVNLLDQGFQLPSRHRRRVHLAGPVVSYVLPRPRTTNRWPTTSSMRGWRRKPASFSSRPTAMGTATSSHSTSWTPRPSWRSVTTIPCA